MDETSRWRLVFYQDERERRPVEEWLLGLEVKDRTKLRRAFDLLEMYGTTLTMPYARHLEGKLWELRIPSGRQDYRVVYAAIIGRRFILLHAFAKQTAKTPAQDLEIARRRWNNYLKRHLQEK